MMLYTAQLPAGYILTFHVLYRHCVEKTQWKPQQHVNLLIGDRPKTTANYDCTSIASNCITSRWN